MLRMLREEVALGRSSATGKGETQSLEQIWASLKVEAPLHTAESAVRVHKAPDVSVRVMGEGRKRKGVS